MIETILKILNEEVKKFRVPIVDLIKTRTNDPFKVLIATVLSARTKDETVAKVIGGLFDKVKSFEDLSKLTVKQIETLIFPVGFYKNKAKFLKQIPYVIDDEFNGKIPETISELMLLPGVGRKTANLVVAVAFNKPAICVDVHVHRILNRIGYVKTKTPLETEMKLREILPRKYWISINRILVAFGQNTCRPISPNCVICPVKKYCEFVNHK